MPQFMEIDPQMLERMNWEDLLALRRGKPKEVQNLIAPYEHRAYARETIRENPWMAAPIAIGTLGYQPYKMLFGARSEPSLKQVGYGLQGVYEGLFKTKN